MSQALILRMLAWLIHYTVTTHRNGTTPMMGEMDRGMKLADQARGEAHRLEGVGPV
jgi:hypothetical protein